MRRALIACAAIVIGAVAPTAPTASAASGGGMTVRVNEKSECAYRPGQLIAPSGRSGELGKVLGASVRELTSLTPDGKGQTYPAYIDRLSLYSVAGVDPFDAAITLSENGITAAPNYLSSFSPVRTWAPGEDAKFFAGTPATLAAPGTGKGLRIGVFDSGLARSFGSYMPGAAYTYVSAASRQAELVGRSLVEPGYFQPREQTTGRVAGHGTFIAGLIRRVAPSAEMVIAQVPYYNGDDANFDVAAAPGFASTKSSRVDDAALAYMMVSAFMGGDSITDVEMLSLSFGTYGCGTSFEPGAGDGDFRTPIGMRNALLHLWEGSGRKLVVSAAAGNDGTDQPFFPAAYSATSCFVPSQLPPSGLADCQWLGVAKSPWVDGISSNKSLQGDYSNRAQWAATTAVGSDVISRRHDMKWASWSGTSFAAPCAAISMLLGGHTEWDQVRGTVIDCGLWK